MNLDLPLEFFDHEFHLICFTLLVGFDSDILPRSCVLPSLHDAEGTCQGNGFDTEILASEMISILP